MAPKGTHNVQEENVGRHGQCNGENLPVHPSVKNNKSILRIAVVGTGITGLSCAYMLSLRHEVTIFEKEKELGMDAHSVNLRDNQRLDAPPRAFSPSYYKQLWSLYKHAGVELEPFSWAYSLSIFGARRSYFRVGSKIAGGYRLPSFKGNWLKLFSPSVWIVAFEALRFFRNVSYDFPSSKLSNTTLEQYLQEGRYAQSFARGALLPMLSMVLTCTYAACLEYPMDIIAEYFLTNSSHTQYHSKHGSSDVVKKLSTHCKAVHLETEVQGVHHGQAGKKPFLKYFAAASGKALIQEEFDHIVVASQANTALRLVSTLSQKEQSSLGAIKHEYCQVIVHRDTKMMPKDRRDWSPMNFVQDSKHTRSMFTMWFEQMNGVEGHLFQTLNPLVPVDPSTLISKAVIPRPVVTHSSCQGLCDLRACQGRGNIWYCGAYALRHLPLQENGVRSAVQIAHALGSSPPWMTAKRSRPGREPFSANLRRVDALYAVNFSDRLLLQPAMKGEPQTYWMNFGFWEASLKDGATLTFPAAASHLAFKVGKACELKAGDTLLDVGFGCGDQFMTWTRCFGVSDITGVEAVCEQVDMAQKLVDAHYGNMHSSKIRLFQGTATELCFENETFDKVVAVDSSYHFDSRNDFLEETFRVLKPGGRFAITDALVDRFVYHGFFQRLLIGWLCSMFSIPVANLCSMQELHNQLSTIGFQEIDVKDVTQNIFPGFEQYIKNRQAQTTRLLDWLRLFNFVGICRLLNFFTDCGVKYYLITASKPTDHDAAPQYFEE